MPKKVIIILTEGFEEIEAVTSIDILRRAGLDVTVAGLNVNNANANKCIRGAHDLWVETNTKFSQIPKDELAKFEAIVLPGGMPGTTNLAKSQELLAFIKAMHDSGKICAAICAAPSVLAKAGVLKEGTHVTFYPGCEKLFDADVLNSLNVLDDEVVCEGKIITGRSAGTAVQFALTVAGMLVSEDVENKVREQLKI